MSGKKARAGSRPGTLAPTSAPDAGYLSESETIERRKNEQPTETTSNEFTELCEEDLDSCRARSRDGDGVAGTNVHRNQILQPDHWRSPCGASRRGIRWESLWDHLSLWCEQPGHGLQA